MEVKLNEIGHKGGTQNNRTGVLISKEKTSEISLFLCVLEHRKTYQGSTVRR